MDSIALEAGLVVESRYCLDHWLGGGGMGVVWAATHVSTGQAVALKFLRPEYAAELGMHQRFLREARAAAAVRHPNVVAVREVLENDGFPAIMMDLLWGETLAKKLAQAVARVSAAGQVGCNRCSQLWRENLPLRAKFLPRRICSSNSD